MEQGLAMTYAGGAGNTVKHYYDKGKKMACKSKKKKGTGKK